jgi:transcriptional regulator with XRE-family HTH domain
VIARKVGVSKSAWSMLEQGAHSPKLATIEKLSTGLRCQPGNLLDL